MQNNTGNPNKEIMKNRSVETEIKFREKQSISSFFRT